MLRYDWHGASGGGQEPAANDYYCFAATSQLVKVAEEVGASAECMDEEAVHRYVVDNVGYVLEGSGCIVNEVGDQIPLGPGDKLVLPAGAGHGEGSVADGMVHIVDISLAEDLLAAIATI